MVQLFKGHFDLLAGLPFQVGYFANLERLGIRTEDEEVARWTERSRADGLNVFEDGEGRHIFNGTCVVCKVHLLLVVLLVLIIFFRIVDVFL